MKRLLGALSAFALGLSQANAALTTFSVTPGSGANFVTDADGSGNKYAAMTILGAGGGTPNQALVNASGQLNVAGPVTSIDGGLVTLGAKADAKSTATDSTAVTLMQVEKEVSFQLQTIAAAQIADPCGGTKTNANFSSGTSGGSIVTAVSAKKIYVCSVSIVTSTAASVSFIEGTGSSVCTGGTPAADWLNTGTTAANGASFPANGGISAGSGIGTIFQTANANYNLCVIFTTTNTPNVVASISFVQQ